MEGFYKEIDEILEGSEGEREPRRSSEFVSVAWCRLPLLSGDWEVLALMPASDCILRLTCMSCDVLGFSYLDLTDESLAIHCNSTSVVGDHGKTVKASTTYDFIPVLNWQLHNYCSQNHC